MYVVIRHNLIFIKRFVSRITNMKRTKLDISITFLFRKIKIATIFYFRESFFVITNLFGHILSLQELFPHITITPRQSSRDNHAETITPRQSRQSRRDNRAETITPRQSRRDNHDETITPRQNLIIKRDL